MERPRERRHGKRQGSPFRSPAHPDWAQSRSPCAVLGQHQSSLSARCSSQSSLLYAHVLLGSAPAMTGLLPPLTISLSRRTSENTAAPSYTHPRPSSHPPVSASRSWFPLSPSVDNHTARFLHTIYGLSLQTRECVPSFSRKKESHFTSIFQTMLVCTSEPIHSHLPAAFSRRTQSISTTPRTIEMSTPRNCASKGQRSSLTAPKAKASFLHCMLSVLVIDNRRGLRHGGSWLTIFKHIPAIPLVLTRISFRDKNSYK